jgi:hypothetical protein
MSQRDVSRHLSFADRMTQAALDTGIAGTSEWDKIAGGADIYGVQDAIRALLARAEAAERERDEARAERDKLREALEQLILIHERNYLRQTEKLADIPHIARAALNPEEPT